ncbi:MAG: hypothetical protein LAO24_01175 [Acidobacteriia bacterium]|nr:hypothetical protein [Terriglobia bacterium]
MTLAVIIVIAAFLSLVCILGLTVSRSLQVSDGSNFAGQIQPIDVEAFRNLLNVSDDEFLRRRLAGPEFRLVRRARLRAIAAYVQQAGRNAAVLIRIGQAGMAADDPRTAEAARQLVNNALLVRRNAAFALLKIYVALTWPHSGPAASRVFEGYEQLSRSAMLLGRLQNPAVPVRVSARP